MRIKFEEVKKVLQEKLEKHGVPGSQADVVSTEMTRNSLEGIYTHGINRFARLIRNIDEGIVIPNVYPVLSSAFGSFERFDGQLGLGITNALYCMDEAIKLAAHNGVGVVALRNTNHWLRAATYGYQACDAGCAAICFTNTMPNMPTWGAKDSRIGNNPFMMAFPKKDGKHLIVDCAMSQFSYGALELASLEKRMMPIDAGFDQSGNLTKDPNKVIETKRILPTGYWKGAAISFMLDIFAACFSSGNSVSAIGRLEGDEHGVSQVFMAFDYSKITDSAVTDSIIDSVISDLKSSVKAEGTKEIIYTGEKTFSIKEDNQANGIPVDETVWKKISEL